MKKTTILFAVLSVIFILAGAGLQVFCHIQKDDKKSAEENSVKEVYDILCAKDQKELEQIAKDTNLKIEYVNNVAIISDYKFQKYYPQVSAVLNSGKGIDSFELIAFPYYQGQEISAEALKQESDEALKGFVQRFNVTNYTFSINNTKTGQYLDTNSPESYKSVISGDSRLELDIKDKDGYIWCFRAKYDTGYDTVVFKVYKDMNPEMTKDMHYDIDLSEQNAKGQTK